MYLSITAFAQQRLGVQEVFFFKWREIENQGQFVGFYATVKIHDFTFLCVRERVRAALLHSTPQADLWRWLLTLKFTQQCGESCFFMFYCRILGRL